MKIFTVSAWFFTIMPRYDSFLSLQSTPWFQAEFDLTLAALGKKRKKKAARGVRFKSGLMVPNASGFLYLFTLNLKLKFTPLIYLCFDIVKWPKPNGQLGAAANFGDLFKFGDCRQIWRSQMFIKLAFEFGCDVILCLAESHGR